RLERGAAGPGLRVDRRRAFGGGRALGSRCPFGQNGPRSLAPAANVSRRAVMAASAHRPGTAARVRRWKVVLNSSGPGFDWAGARAGDHTPAHRTLAVDDQQLARRLVQDVRSGLAADDDVLDARAVLALEIDAGLDAEGHAGLE